jgi:hypothetical protein
VLGKFMLDRSTRNTDSISAVMRWRMGGVETITPKSISSHLSQVNSAVTVSIALNSASALKQETVVCVLIFQAITEDPVGDVTPPSRKERGRELRR